jgi:hypothetical protein
MIFRAFEDSDKAWVEEMHAKYFAQHFPLPVYTHRYLCAYTVFKDGRRVAVGGVRPLAECTLISDQSLPAITRLRAFRHMLDFNKYIASQDGFHTIYAFVHTPTWQRALEDLGPFIPVTGTPLQLEFTP